MKQRLRKLCEKTGDIIGWELDVWTMSQDWNNPRVEVLSSSVEDDTHASAKIKIVDGSNKTPVTLALVLEDGRWVIDDFVHGEMGSYKEGMKQEIQNYKVK